MEWGSLFRGLKIEWEVVLYTNENLYRYLSVHCYQVVLRVEHTYEMMCKANGKACSIGLLAE